MRFLISDDPSVEIERWIAAATNSVDAAKATALDIARLVKHLNTKAAMATACVRKAREASKRLPPSRREAMTAHLIELQTVVNTMAAAVRGDIHGR